MKDFKSYTKGGGEKPDGNGGKFDDDKGVKLVKQVADSMKGKSSGEIMRTVIDEAERGKRAGTLTNADLDNFYQLMAPTLDGFRRRKLKSIVDRLKKL